MTASEKVLEKVHERVIEKRRALGRGLESLLPGPRVVAPVPAVPQSARKDGAADSTSSQFPVLSSQEGKAGSTADGDASSRGGGGLPGAMPGTLEQVQAVAAGLPVDGEVVQIELGMILQNPYQTRTEFDPKALTDLAGSIQAQGVLQPIVVRPLVRPMADAHVRPPSGLTAGPGVQAAMQEAREPGVGPEVELADGKQRFILILGERRYRATKIAGKSTIPAIVKRVSEQQAAEMTLVENLQRQDLDCLDQAAAFATLSKEFKLTQEDIGKRVGVSREQVSNYMRLLMLPPEVQVALRTKQLTYSHARLLLALDEEQILNVARVAIAKKMSVALLTEMVTDVNLPKDGTIEKKAGGARWVDPNVRAEQRSLEAVLGLKVRIRDRRGKGKILIEYSTLEDFDRIVAVLKRR